MGLFKKKPGGSKVGNFLRKVQKGVADKVGLGFVVDLVNPVPAAPAPVQAKAEELIQKAAYMPALSAPLAQGFAAQAAQQLIGFGATQSEAEAVQHEVLKAAQTAPPALQLTGSAPSNETPPVKPTTSVKLSDLDAVLGASQTTGLSAAEVERTAQATAEKTGISKSQILTILKDGGIAAKDAMVQSWLDKTKSGQDTKNEAIWAQVEKYAPYGLGAVGLIWFLKRQGIIK